MMIGRMLFFLAVAGAVPSSSMTLGPCSALSSSSPDGAGAWSARSGMAETCSKARKAKVTNKAVSLLCVFMAAIPPLSSHIMQK